MNISILNCTVSCGHPLINQSVEFSSLNVLDSSESGPAIVGTNISFSCSNPRDVLIGPNMSTCVDTGLWEPDPALSICKGN